MIYLYKRAVMVSLKYHMAQFTGAYLSEDHSHMSFHCHMSVNDMWYKFKTGFVEVKNDQNKILCAMDRCNNQTACEKGHK